MVDVAAFAALYVAALPSNASAARVRGGLLARVGSMHRGAAGAVGAALFAGAHDLPTALVLTITSLSLGASLAALISAVFPGAAVSSGLVATALALGGAVWRTFV